MVMINPFFSKRVDEGSGRIKLLVYGKLRCNTVLRVLNCLWESSTIGEECK